MEKKSMYVKSSRNFRNTEVIYLSLFAQNAENIYRVT